MKQKIFEYESPKTGVTKLIAKKAEALFEAIVTHLEDTLEREEVLTTLKKCVMLANQCIDKHNVVPVEKIKRPRKNSLKIVEG